MFGLPILIKIDDDFKNVSRFAVTQDNRLLAVAMDDGTIRLWDVSSGAAKLVLSGHTLGIS